MSSYVIEFNEQTIRGQKIMSFFETLKLPVVPIRLYKKKVKSQKNGLDEAIEDIKNGRVTTCNSFEEFVEKINS